jgi:isopentenyl-diphosphate delta-isomerase
MTSRPEQSADTNTNGMSPAEDVVLVDDEDVALGSMEKWLAHAEGRLHRAFSIFVFRPDVALLLQRRASSKYYSGGLW